MTPSWDDLASSERWRGVVAFIRNWVGPLDHSDGFTSETLDEARQAEPVRLPAAVREWCRLAGNWDQRGLKVWVRPGDLTPEGGVVWVLTDPQGITAWGVRAGDLGADDPPVVSREAGPGEPAFTTFSGFVGAMVVNDVLFGDPADPPAELSPGLPRGGLTCLAASRVGDYFADGPLGSAEVVVFAYPGDGPVLGKARTAGGRALLQRLRLPPG